MNIPDFKDSFISDKDIFYYPKSVLENYRLQFNGEKFGQKEERIKK